MTPQDRKLLEEIFENLKIRIEKLEDEVIRLNEALFKATVNHLANLAVNKK